VSVEEGKMRLPVMIAPSVAARPAVRPMPAEPIMASLAVYGNWCGPGHGGGGPPIDAVDAVCERHDHCYDERGYFDCSCDRELVAGMPAAIADPATPVAGKVAGAAAAALFQALPCLCHRICLPFIGCVSTPLPVPGVPGAKVCPPPFA